MIKKAKRLLQSGARAAGVQKLVRDSAWRRHRVAILCYHGVSLVDEHEWDSSLFVRQDFLARRLEFLQRGGYNVLPLDEAVTRLYQRSLPPRSVVLTFDDGNHDFLARAIPVMKEYEVPATVYLTTYYAENDFAVFDVMARYIIWKGRMRVPAIAPLMKDLDLEERTGWEDASNDLVRAVKYGNWSALAKEQLLYRLAEALEVDYDALVEARVLRIMTPAEVSQTAELGFDVQLHTHRHRTPSEETLFQREIRDNAKAIERMTGRTPNHFCYPQGWVEPEFVPWLADLGVRSATTTRTGLASPSSDPLLLPRIIDHPGLSSEEFESALTGVAAFFPKRPSRPLKWG